MYKSIFKNSFFFIISVFLNLNIVSFCFAQSFRHAPTNKILEFSLKSLRESAGELEEKNKWLIEVMGDMRKQIGQMRRDMKVLEKKKKNLVNNLDVVHLSLSREKGEASLAKQGMDRLKQQMLALQKEKELYQQQVDARKSQEKEVNEKISAIKEDVLNIDNEISGEKAELFRADPQKKAISLALATSKKEIKNLREEMGTLERKFGKPLKDIERHRDKKNILQVRFENLEKNYKEMLNDTDGLEKEIESKKGQKTQKMEMITSEIKQLKSKSQELEKVLFQAKQRLKGVSLDSPDFSRQHQRLATNVDLAKMQNSALQNELLLLKEKLKKPE